MRGRWRNIPEVVGCINGTSHEIYRPNNEIQQMYYSGHRRFHCIHTQVVIDNELRIRHVESGFLGHTNDAQSFALMSDISENGQLPIPLHGFFTWRLHISI